MAPPVSRSLAREAVDRLLTHRVSGFRDRHGELYPEGSREALVAALAAGRSEGEGQADDRERAPRGVAYIEIDTRVTADGQILVYHDAKLSTITTADGNVADYDLAARGPIEFAIPRQPGAPRGPRQPSGFMVPTLEEFLGEFAAADSDAVLLVDLKDPIDPRGNPGWLEREHCRLLREHGLTDRVWIISWYPEVLWRVFEINPDFRLGFSHLPFPSWARPMTGPGRLLANPWLVATLGLAFPSLEGVEIYFDDEEPREERARRPGRFPIHVLTRLPRGKLGRALRESGGGAGGSVGLKAFLLRRSYVRAARAAGLRTFVYTIDDTERFVEAVREAEPDMIFSDDARGILADLLPVAGAG